MSEREDRSGSGAEDDAEWDEEEIASTPFDNPFFLPVILLGFAVWFIYDGWFNPDMEWLKFNRVGAAVTTSLGLYFLFKAVRERQES